MRAQLTFLFVIVIILNSCNTAQENNVANDHTEAVQPNIDSTYVLIEQYGKEGVTLFANGDFEGALAKFDLLLELDSANVEAHLRKGDCLGSLGKYDECIASYSNAIKFDSTYKIAYFNRGTTYQAGGDFEKAARDYFTATEIDIPNMQVPDNKQVFFNLGVVSGQIDELDNAIDAFTSAIELDPTFAAAYFNRGLAYQLREEYEIALEEYQEAIKLDSVPQHYHDAVVEVKKLMGK